MIKIIKIKDTTIQYDLQYKKVKNINLRIKPNGSINVSANKRVPQKVIDDFIISKEVIQLFRKYNVCEYIMNCYGELHTTGTNYIINDIDLYIEARQVAV